MESVKLKDLNQNGRSAEYETREADEEDGLDTLAVAEDGETPRNPDIPDGGFGWVVVIAVFAIHFIIDGLTYSFGVIFPELLAAHNSNKFAASWIFSILIGTTYGCGPIPSILSMRFGRRPVAITGALLAVAGTIVTSFATQIWHFVVAFGLMTGLGFGFMYLPAVVTVNSWFEKRRALAVGLALSGTGIGTITMAPVSRYLLNEYALEGCFLIYAGVILNGFVFCASLRPTPAEEREALRRKRGIQTENQKLLKVEETTVRSSETGDVIARRIHLSLFERIKAKLDMDLMRKWKFWVFCLAAFFGGISSYIPYNFLPHKAETESGFHKDDSAYLVSYIGIANLVGRLASSAISDCKCINRILLYSVSCIIAGTGTAASIYCHTNAEYIMYCLVYGFFGGIIIALQSVVLTDIVGLSKLTAAFGILLFIEGLAVYVGPPSAAFITDVTENYSAAFIVFGGLMAMAGICLLAVPVNKVVRRTVRKSRRSVE